jgi:hypothetical protein
MKVMYAALAIPGLVEYAHPPVKTQVARAQLEETIKYIALEPGLIVSYAIADDLTFPYPHKMPDNICGNPFYGFATEKDVERELAYLYAESVREKEETVKKTMLACMTASEEELLVMFDKFYYTKERARKSYASAGDNLKSSWGEWKDLEEDILDTAYSAIRVNLAESLQALDDCHARAYVRERAELQAHMKAGRRNEAMHQVILAVSNWVREHTSPFENYCGDACFYGAGCWYARMVVNPNPPAECDGKPIDEHTLARHLKGWSLPCFEVDLEVALAN